MQAQESPQTGQVLPVAVPQPSTMTVLPQLQITDLDAVAVAVERDRRRWAGQLTVVSARLRVKGVPQTRQLRVSVVVMRGSVRCG